MTAKIPREIADYLEEILNAGLAKDYSHDFCPEGIREKTLKYVKQNRQRKK